MYRRVPHAFEFSRVGTYNVYFIYLICFFFFFFLVLRALSLPLWVFCYGTLAYSHTRYVFPMLILYEMGTVEFWCNHWLHVHDTYDEIDTVSPGFYCRV